MGGLIVGENVGRHRYVEGRFEWVDKYHDLPMEGLRGYVGYRF
jgi:hypothetical protein